MLEIDNHAEKLGKLIEAKRLLGNKIKDEWVKNKDFWKNNVLLQEFVALLGFAIKNNDYFSDEDQALLVNLANSATQKITDPHDEKNNMNQANLMSQVCLKAKEEIERGDSDGAFFWNKVALCVTGAFIMAAGIATSALCFITGNPVAGGLALAGTAILMAAVITGWKALINNQKRCLQYGLFDKQVQNAVSTRPLDEIASFEVKPDLKNPNQTSAFFKYPKALISKPDSLDRERSESKKITV